MEGFPAPGQLLPKLRRVPVQPRYRRQDLGVQLVPIGVFHGAQAALAPLLGGAEIGILPRPVRPCAAGQLGAQIVPAAAAAKQAGQQGLVAAGAAMAPVPVPGQAVLDLHPFCPGDNPRVPAHGNNPLLHGPESVSLAGLLEGAVIGQDTADPVKVLRLPENLRPVAGEVLVGLPVGDQVDRVREDIPDGHPGEWVAPLGAVLLFQQEGVHLGEGAGLQEFLENQLHQAQLPGQGVQVAGPLGLAVDGDLGDAL